MPFVVACAIFSTIMCVYLACFVYFLEKRLSKIELIFINSSFQRTLEVVKDELRDAESLKKEMVEMLKDYNKAKKK
jgi:hypothetical protein